MYDFEVAISIAVHLASLQGCLTEILGITSNIVAEKGNNYRHAKTTFVSLLLAAYASRINAH